MRFFFVAVTALALTGCPKEQGVPGAADLSAYAADQAACVELADATADADACRAARKAEFCSKFPDLQVCGGDGGN